VPSRAAPLRRPVRSGSACVWRRRCRGRPLRRPAPVGLVRPRCARSPSDFSSVMGMNHDARPVSPYRRRHRLPLDCYPAGHPVHVTLCAYGRETVFRNTGLAEPLFALVADHSQTLACCLMPDHLHWLIADAAAMRQLVHSFKSYSTYAARTLGHRRKLWQRSYWDHVLRRDEDLRQVAEYIIHNPVRHELVEDARAYPYQIVKM